MAKALHKIERLHIDPDVKQQQEKDEVLTALLENKESLLSLISLLDKLEDRGILDLLNGLVGQGDKVLAVATREVSKPGVSDTLDHMMNMAQMIGEIEVNKMKSLAGNVNAGLAEAEKRIENGDSTSLFDLVKMLKDPDVNRSVTALVGFLKGAGQSTK